MEEIFSVDILVSEVFLDFSSHERSSEIALREKKKNQEKLIWVQGTRLNKNILEMPLKE